MYYNIKEIINFVKPFRLTKDGYFTENEVENFIYSIDSNTVPDFTWDTGATKLVIVPFDRDYVIKIPFNADYEYTRFEGMKYASNNYCEVETVIYNFAKELNYQDLFLPVECVYHTIEDKYPIYIQEKVDHFYINTGENDKKKSYNSKALKEVDKEFGEDYFNPFFGKLPFDWLAGCLLILNYDFKKLRNFLYFLEKYDITDLHELNFGYTVNNTPVIIDYGGYNEE